MTKRWPTFIGVAGGALGAFAVFSAGDRAKGAAGFATGVACMALIYMITFAWGRPERVWIAFPAAGVLVGVLSVVTDPGYAVAGLVAALVLAWIAAIVRGAVRTGAWFTIETVGGLFFGGLALAAVAVDVRLGGVLAGLGFLTHGAWDAYHLVKDRIVSRSYAEFCAVVDIIIGIALPLAALSTSS